MNMENRLPDFVRSCAKQRNGSPGQSFPPEVVSRAKNELKNAPAFESLAVAAEYAGKQKAGASVFKNPDNRAKPYAVLTTPQYQVGLFAGYAFVIPDAVLDEAITALTGGTDTIEEV